MRKRYPKKQKRRKGIYILPNLITSASLYFGFCAVLAAFSGKFSKAAMFILISAVLDALDGRIARLTNSTSRFGVEYDSLSDLVAFGVAPAVLLYNSVLVDMGRFGAISAFMFLVCGALRLARFNTQTCPPHKDHFTGLPIPGAAGFVASGILLVQDLELSSEVIKILGVILSNLMAFLMVSTIKYPAFKSIHPRIAKPFHVLVISILFLLPILYQPQFMLFALFSAYIIVGPFYEPLRSFVLLKREKIAEGKPEDPNKVEVKGHI